MAVAVNPELETSWQRCWPALGASGDGQQVMARLLDAYQEPQRKYHTAQHLAECLQWWEACREQAEKPAEVEMSLWFHDAVYDVKGRDNEARSAAWAVQALREAGVSEESLGRISALILATRHSVTPETSDQQLLVDIDLAILGAPRPRFDAYEAQIREEYRWVPDALYSDKRREVLAGFEARDAIYRTPRLYALLEAQARSNLAHALSQL
ncbi:Predicted metal-dependent phosphohydrolase, HD superfamily [Marinobacter zhejiangensis]|uniref:Predicted metal-dependent phosphohydrolase, HD superfamily n=2 Tax=Marinobacter zhejiangensis TaxID=488535 RepID=A0A1I4QFR6_9GAMM|nr:Predicted metal-dependent phosphohydrolase, HD superfamily [Marinobacter zhejiangensis]